MTYGGTPPGVTPAYSGFVNGDTASSLTTQADLLDHGDELEPGLAPDVPDHLHGRVESQLRRLVLGGGHHDQPGRAHRHRLQRSVTYGSTPPAIIPGYAGFVNGDTASSLTTKPTCTTTATSASPVSGSPYPSSCTGAVDANYSFAYVPGSVTVNQAALTVTASSVSMTYGSTPPAITAVYTGFVNGDTASSLTTKPTCTTTATSASPVAGSPYSSSCSGAFDPNYTIAYATGAVTVTKAPLTVTASSGSMTYGGTPPAVIPAYAGFVNGDNPSSLTTQATCSTTATSSSPASPPTYPTTCTGASSPNYAVSYVGGGDHGQPGRPHRHRLERLHDLWGHAAGDRPGLRRLRQRRFAGVAHDRTDLLGRRHQREPRLGLSVLRRRAREPSTPTTRSPTSPGSVTVTRSRSPSRPRTGR